MPIKLSMKKFSKDEIAVLLIDESEKQLKDFNTILTRNGLYIRTVESGLEALSVVEKERFHIVLIAREMVEMSGLETTMLLRETFRKDVLPIIIYSDDKSEAAVKEAKDFGANDYAFKGDVNDIIRKVRKWNQVRLQVADVLKKRQKTLVKAETTAAEKQKAKTEEPKAS